MPNRKLTALESEKIWGRLASGRCSRPLVFLIPRAIFAEAALSYIGIGVSPPTPSWGTMAQEGYGVIFVAYEQVLFPVLAISMAMLAFTLLGEGLRDLMDPRNSRR